MGQRCDVQKRRAVVGSVPATGAAWNAEPVQPRRDALPRTQRPLSRGVRSVQGGGRQRSETAARGDAPQASSEPQFDQDIRQTGIGAAGGDNAEQYPRLQGLSNSPGPG